LLRVWCGGWGSNPRRPTPSGPQPDPTPVTTAMVTGSFLKQGAGFKFSQKELGRFTQWCRKHASERVCRGYISYLNKPLDEGNRWSITAWKRYWKYRCEERRDKKACEKFKELKSKRSRSDLYIPSDQEVFEGIRHSEQPFSTVFWVLAQSGLRLTEAAYLLSNIDNIRIVELGGFLRAELQLERGTKKAFWAYLLEMPPKIVVHPKAVSDYASENKLLAPKYYRKWVAQKLSVMGCDLDTIDFIQGRTPSRILTKHYVELTSRADKCYSEYAEWLRGWLNGALAS
ncbi:MAG: hypothetical protein F7B59_04830, partial [Desulfurococcales archaeon]|nr:hypothetical protein [Desulfurococcales archaeon]